MRQNLDNVEIIEPPIQELKKGRSCARRSCTTGCGCLILFIVAFLFLLKFTGSPRSKELKDIPNFFPDSVSVYDEENIESITYFPGKQDDKIFNLASYLPKVFLMPIFIIAESYAPEEVQNKLAEVGGHNFLKKYIYLLRQPLTKQKQIIEIKWTELSAKPDFVNKYYQTELVKQNYQLIITTDTDTFVQLAFSKDGVEGTLYLRDDPEKEGTDLVILTVAI